MAGQCITSRRLLIKKHKRQQPKKYILDQQLSTDHSQPGSRVGDIAIEEQMVHGMVAPSLVGNTAVYEHALLVTKLGACVGSTGGRYSKQ